LRSASASYNQATDAGENLLWPAQTIPKKVLECTFVSWQQMSRWRERRKPWNEATGLRGELHDELTWDTATLRSHPERLFIESEHPETSLRLLDRRAEQAS
jgi:hypothetical protein